ncbi:DUF4411 domain-containing protein [Flavipsychrobacter stenotrophus]|uniref:DUF4411 domain-containing protein n=1 Tax=Flavipsychrobacter stenotrophus TaxID=2077091 RepID=A0A2S7SZ49_9BACT|nr:DUF4411 family protein [Flavipsychrobacter stenotrophus]PQJ11881.1 DUF4411 domain-containing protein [Flavipsychrobacter stenotrophus]
MSVLNPNALFVFDAGPLINLKYYPRDIFPTLWEKLQSMADNGSIISCAEVYREVSESGDEASQWAETNKHIFGRPSLEEQSMIQQILTKHPELVRKKNRLTGRPVADPFVLSCAKVHRITLVHEELFKAHSHGIANVCQELAIKNINLHGFFKETGWKF